MAVFIQTSGTICSDLTNLDLQITIETSLPNLAFSLIIFVVVVTRSAH